MEYVWLTGLVLLNGIWLFLVVLGLPGNWLMVASTALVAWLYWDQGLFSLETLVALAALATLGELLELGTALVGSKAGGGTGRGSLGALAGGFGGAVLGTIFIPVPLLGSLVGACLGAGLGAWGLEIQGGLPGRRAVRSGVGAGVGRFFGTVLKLSLGVLIWLVAAVAAFWP